MCGKGSSGGGGFGSLAPIQQSTTQASPQAIQAYTKALGLADVAAAQPFQQYSSDPNAFVAPLTGTQQQAIGGIQGAQGAYQPYYGAAGALTAGAGATTTPQVVGQYMSPYMSQVVDPVKQALGQQQAMQLNQQKAEQARAGAFGQQRGQMERAYLRGQQQLGLGQALSPLFQTGYGQALQGAQADLSRQLQAGQALGQLGTGAQTAALAAPQALLGAGTLEQQTEQAGKTALYNQFLQQRAYPYQQAQFYANVAGGLGPLLGQQTFQSQAQNPFGMFLSEPGAKMGVDGYADGGFAQDRSQPDVVGKTFDDQNIYAYRYKDGSPAQLGLMADEVQQAHPEAVGYAPTGDRMVDYAAATDNAARLGGAVKDTGGDYARGGYAIGGHLAYIDPSDPTAADRRRMDALIASHKGGLSGAATEYGPSGQSYVTQKTYVPAGTVRAGQQLEHARFSPIQSKSGLANALETGEKISGLLTKGSKAYDMWKNRNAPTSERVARETSSRVSSSPSELLNSPDGFFAQGGIVPTSYIPEDITGEVRASQPLRPAEISRKEQEESGLNKLMGVGERALDIGIKYGPLLAKGAAMLAASEPGMKTGVRPAAQSGLGVRGSEDEDIFEKGIIGAESRGRQFDKEGRPLTSSAGAIGIAQVMPGTAPEAARLAGLEYDPVRYRNDPEYNKALGKAYFNKQLETFGSEDKAAAAYNAGPGALRKALQRAEREGGDYLSYLPAETRAYVPKVMGLAGARGEPMQEETRLTPETVSAARAGLARDRIVNTYTPEQRRMMALDESSREGVGAAKPKEEGGLGDYLTSEEFLIPALTGLGTAVTSAMQAPTTSLGSALGMGLGAGTVAGAKSVLETKRQQADIEKAKQEAGLFGRQADVEKVEAGKRMVETAKNAILTDSQGYPIGLVAVDPATGVMRPFDWGEAYNRREELNLLPELRQEVEAAQTLKERGVPYKQPTVTSAPTEQVTEKKIVEQKPGGKEIIEKEKEKVTGLQPIETLFGVQRKDAPKIEQAISRVTRTGGGDEKDLFKMQFDRARDANTQKPIVMEFAEAFSRLPEKGPAAPGPLQPAITKGASILNNVLNLFNMQEAFNPTDIGTADEIRKIGVRMQKQMAEAAGQRSYSAFNELASGTPSGATTREGIAKNMASIIVNNQKDIDKQPFFNQWYEDASRRNPSRAWKTGSLADSAFNEAYNSRYEQDRKSIEDMFLTPVQSGGKPIMDEKSGRPMNWIQYVSKYGSSLPEETKVAIEKEWGPGILRYFPSVTRQ